MANELRIDALIAKIEAVSGSSVEVYPGIRNDETVLIPVDQLHDAISVLRDDFGCCHLTAITAQQRETQLDEIELIYHFWHGKGLSLMVRLPLDAPEVATIITLIPGADFYEREVAEMYGVSFTGRAETPHLLLPEGWDQGPPFIQREVADE
jgi:NADH:ubiquinone oxidoreductase subunit C